MPSGTVPHPSLAKASDAFSRKREKERALAPAALLSAEDEVLREAGLARLLVFRVHVAPGVSEGLDRGVEIHPVARGNLVGRDHVRGPGFHGAEGATLDAGHLHIAR